MATFSYSFKAPDQWLDSCNGCGKAEVGDTLALVIAIPSGNTTWPNEVIATITDITRTTGAPVYTFEYDEALWIPAADIRDCDISGTRCIDCCDSLTAAQVLPALDADNSGQIDPAYIPAPAAADIVAALTGDTDFEALVLAIVDGELATRTFDCSNI